MHFQAGLGNDNSGFLDGRKTAQARAFAISGNDRSPFLVSHVPMDSFNATCVILPQFAVLNIWPVRRFPQVQPTVISIVGVFMIDDIDRIRASFQLPNDPMRQVVFLGDANHDISIFADRARDLSTAFVVVTNV